MKYCPACGNVVDDIAKFCFRCGHQFASAVASPSPTVADAADVPAEEQPSEPAMNAAMEAAAPSETPPAAEDTLAEDVSDTLAEDTSDEPAEDTSDESAEDSPFVMEVRPKTAPKAAPAPAPKPAFDMSAPVQQPTRELLSTFQYILLIILFSIPVVGIVFLFIFGCGNPNNPSLKRFALAVLILTLVMWILIIAAAIVCYVAYADTLSAFLRTFLQWVAGLDLSVLGL